MAILEVGKKVHGYYYWEACSTGWWGCFSTPNCHCFEGSFWFDPLLMMFLQISCFGIDFWQDHSTTYYYDWYHLTRHLTLYLLCFTLFTCQLASQSVGTSQIPAVWSNITLYLPISIASIVQGYIQSLKAYISKVKVIGDIEYGYVVSSKKVLLLLVGWKVFTLAGFSFLE